MSKRKEIPIAGQIFFKYDGNLGCVGQELFSPLSLRQNYAANIGSVSEKNNNSKPINVITEIDDEELIVDKGYLDESRVAFLNPSIIPYIKNNLQSINRSDVLVDAHTGNQKKDEEIALSLLLLPRGAKLKEIYPKQERFRTEYILLLGSILVFPITETEGYYHVQRYLYVGNFSHEEKIYKKGSIGCKKQKFINDADDEYDFDSMPIRTISVGRNLPAYKGMAVRVQLSVTGKNQILPIKD